MNNPMSRTYKEFFVYGANFLALGAGQTQTQTVVIQADADFELLKTTYASDLAAGVQTDSTRTIPQCTLLITDTGSGKQLMSVGIDLTNLFGTGADPFILPISKRFAANSALTLALTNYSSAQSYNIRLALIGAKIRG